MSGTGCSGWLGCRLPGTGQGQEQVWSWTRSQDGSLAWAQPSGFIYQVLSEPRFDSAPYCLKVTLLRQLTSLLHASI